MTGGRRGAGGKGGDGGARGGTNGEEGSSDQGWVSGGEQARYVHYVRCVVGADCLVSQRSAQAIGSLRWKLLEPRQLSHRLLRGNQHAGARMASERCGLLRAEQSRTSYSLTCTRMSAPSDVNDLTAVEAVRLTERRPANAAASSLCLVSSKKLHICSDAIVIFSEYCSGGDSSRMTSKHQINSCHPAPPSLKQKGSLSFWLLVRLPSL